MAEFAVWSRENLEKFATDSSERIAQLEAALKAAEDDRKFTLKLYRSLVQSQGTLTGGELSAGAGDTGSEI
jgi:hypothetical protein